MRDDEATLRTVICALSFHGFGKEDWQALISILKAGPEWTTILGLISELRKEVHPQDDGARAALDAANELLQGWMADWDQTSRHFARARILAEKSLHLAGVCL